MPDNADTTNIDELIAYIESPEYLRMTAAAQGENPHNLVPPAPTEISAPTQFTYEPVPRPVVHNVRTCTCPVCTRTRNRARPAPVRLRSRKDTFQKFAEVLGDFREFDTPTNSLRGVREIERDGNPGRLGDASPAGLALWRADRPVMDYVVYSYDTPIAWHVRGDGFSEWVIPNASYSQTTTQHQNKINASLEFLRNDGEEIRYLREEEG